MKRFALLVLLLPLVAHATVTNQTLSVSFTCTGSTGPYPFTFPISGATGLQITQNGTVLASTAYTVTPVNNNYANGGSVTLNSVCPSAQTLVILRVTPLTQTTVFTDNMPTPMASIGNAVDKLTEIVQEKSEYLFNIPYCSGFSPSVGQTVAYTNTSTPNPCWQAANIGGGGSSGVTSLNALTGALVLVPGTGIAITPIGGGNIQISLAAAFAITSFTGGWTVPVGASVVNPTFAATYSTTPASANITNTEGISSPTNLTTPFTSGTITGTFVHTTPETTTFTLSATQGSTVTATQTGNWEYEIFGGVGTAGATSSVTASGTTAVLSNSNVLPRTQIGSETVGETFGPFSPSGQVIYLLLTGGSHTFTDAGTGFPMAFNAPLTVTFLNANGVTLTMYLYQSTNSLYGTYTPKVAS